MVRSYKKFILGLSLSIFLVSCQQKPQEPNSANANTQPSPSLPNSMEEYEPTLPSLDQRIWNTDDVDISSINPSHKLVAFTFDDAPSRFSENLLNVFASFNEENPDYQSSATIFYNGKRLDKNAVHLLHATKTLGIELGNHTYSHYDLTTLSKDVLQTEIDKVDQFLQKIDGKPRHLLRAPFGRVNNLVREVASTPIMDWTIDTLDWSGKSEEEIYNCIFDHIFPGAIVLMHDGYPNTVSALKRLLPDLRKIGYQVVSVSALAKMHHCTLETGKVYIKASKSVER